MEKLLIKGGNRLSGTITCSGAKNAALPMIAATILSKDSVVLRNLPFLQDITTMFELLGSMGAQIILNEDMDFTISSNKLSDTEARYELVKTMRASILVLGPLVARYGKARIALPGGCAIGSRPVNFHLDALEQLGAKIELKRGYIEATADRLQGTRVKFDGITVTGTENIMMAAALAEGTSYLTNVAKEPEIVDLAEMLNAMGANIKGAGTDEIVIEGVEELTGVTFDIPADRIEAGTYLAAAVVTAGDIRIDGINPDRLKKVLEKYKKNNEDIWSSITTNQGSVSHLNFLTDTEKDTFKTAFEIDQRWIVELGADRTPHISQAQSINVFVPADIHKKELHQIHYQAWKKGLKSLYYCRSKSIQRAEDVTAGSSTDVTKNVYKNKNQSNNEENNYEECLSCQ